MEVGADGGADCDRAAVDDQAQEKALARGEVHAATHYLLPCLSDYSPLLPMVMTGGSSCNNNCNGSSNCNNSSKVPTAMAAATVPTAMAPGFLRVRVIAFKGRIRTDQLPTAENRAQNAAKCRRNPLQPRSSAMESHLKPLAVSVALA